MRERQREKRKSRGAERRKKSVCDSAAKRGTVETKTWIGREEGGEGETEREERRGEAEMKAEKEQGGKEGLSQKKALRAKAPSSLHASGVGGGQILSPPHRAS